MEYTREKARQESRHHRRQHGNGQRKAQGHHGGTDRRAGTNTSVHGQIGNVQHLIGDVNTDRHDSPDHTLRHRAGQRGNIV